MPSTPTNLHYHVVFSTKNRFPHIAASWRSRLHEYLGGSIRGMNGTPLEAGGTADHVHLLIGLKATHTLADVVREIKKASTGWVQESFDSKFHWQDGYGAFTVGRDEIEAIRQYIRNQEEHHRHRPFQEEYVEFLKHEGIAYDPKFVW